MKIKADVNETEAIFDSLNKGALEEVRIYVVYGSCRK